jgi:uncharacterized protein (DUF2141 family)
MVTSMRPATPGVADDPLRLARLRSHGRPKSVSRKLYWAAIAVWLSSQPAVATELEIEVRNLNGAGDLYLGLFKEGDPFPEKPAARLKIPVTRDRVSGTFSKLDPGEYAVSGFQDENSNGALDRNLVGVPTERFGFSKDAIGRTGPPKFSDAKVSIGSDDLKIVINLR